MSATCTNTVSSDGKYIIQKIVGDLKADLALRFNVDAHVLGREMGIKRYLIDLAECKNVASVIDTYDFAYHDMPLDPGIDRFAAVAVLVFPEDHSHDFVEVLARNAGLDVTIF